MIYIASDHAGYELKCAVLQVFKNDFVDLGTDSAESCDYPIFARKVCSAVVESQSGLGILICGSGTGMCIAANKHPGIRAANCWSADIARLAREHNNANVLCLGARFIRIDTAIDIINAFISTQFSSEARHIRRLALIERN